MSQRKGVSSVGQEETKAKPQGQAQNKQAILLAEDAGHFSLIKAMHLADVITEMNGFCGCTNHHYNMKDIFTDKAQSWQSYLQCDTAWALPLTSPTYT